MKQQTEERLAWVWFAAWLIKRGRLMQQSPDHLERLAGESMVAMGRDSLKRAQRLQEHLERCLATTLDSETD